METAIISLISMALILVGTLTMDQGALSSVDATADSWQQAEERTGEMRRTNLEALVVSVQGTLVDVTLRNGGRWR